MNPEMAMVMKRNEEREALRSVIQQWNANRLDLFELSDPNENLEFHGVMRFYFQDSGQKVATKCIRVASDATAQDVVETLIEKFRPDMRMLSLPEYALFEIHENGEERKLAMDEKPLLVQLNWHKDDREGRFLLRRLDDKTNVAASTFQQDGSSFRRKLSKREKKQLKKQEKMNRIQSRGGSTNDENDVKVAEKLYSELPETSFTRSISNPEAVMRRRRQQILERKLQQFRSKDGGPDTGGTLKIYGESLCRDVPYKTLLLSIRDTAQAVVKEMLNKYGLDKEDPHNYCLVQVNGMSEYSKENKDYHPNNVANNNNNNNHQECILDDDECPLAILMTQSTQGSIMFHVRRRPADYHPRKRKKKPQHKWNQHQSGSNELLEYRYEDGLDRLPLFLELNPDGTEICGGAAKRHRLHPNVTEVGCERNTSPTQTQYLQLFGPNILPRHCVIANTEGIVTVTPCSRDSETYVNGQRIYETTILRNGAIVKFGRIHCFRFLDPYFEERLRQRHDSLRNIHEYAYDRQSTKDETSSQTTLSMDRKSPRNVSLPHQQHPHQQQQQQQQQQHHHQQNNMTDPQLAHNFETTFDVDGNIETRSTSSQGNKEDSRSQRSVGSGSKDGNRIPGSSYQRSGSDAILPAVLEIREETEEALLNEIVTSLNPNLPSFKLAPAYCLYLMARYRASTHYRPELTPTERAHRLTLMLERVATLILNVIQEHYCDKEHYCDIKSLALWLANSSELLFFLQFDRHLFAFSKDARRILSDSVQISFRHLVKRIQKSDLAAVMPHFFADKDDTSHESDDSPSVLGVLASAMALLRRYRVNVALTVQLFSHLFHYINVWAFNTLIASNTNYCSRLWGHRLKNRLAQIEAWAERQGLEISTDTHLARIVQAAHLLQAPKYTGEDLASLSSTCFLLNSLQLRMLLMKYQPAPDEPPMSKDLIENFVKVAESLADELTRSDGRDVKLEEDQELKLEFVLPIDSYSCEVVRGIPPGLIEFVAPLQSMGLCRLTTQPTSNGLWTVYMELPSAKGATMRSPSAMSNRSMGYLPGPQEPEIHVIKLHKSNNGMGLSIVAAKGAGQEKLGIYIKAVVKGGAADADGRLQAGDQLLKVDGQSLVGITQERAAEYLVRTGPIVTLEVAKQGAIYHGLATLLSQPSPVMTRGGRRMSERDLPSRISNEQTNQATLLPMHAPLIHSSKSVPSLNSPGVNDGQIVSPVASRSTHEVYNTSYNSTSSTNNISMQHPALRSRSSQNLNDSRSLSNYSQNATPNLSNRQPSNPNLLQNNVPSPHYPYTTNHQMPQQQHPMYHQHVQQQQMLLHQQQQQLQQQQPQPQLHPHHQHQYHYAAAAAATAQQPNNVEGERFYQNLNVYRNHEIQNGGVPDGAGGATMMKGKVLSPQQDRSSNQFQRSFRGSQTSLQQPQGRQSVEILPTYMKERPSSAYLQKENYPPQNMQTMSGRSQSTRDMLRQEAKLQEMTEEVRRREMKANFSPQQYPISPASRIQSPGEPQQAGQQYMHHKPPPPEHLMYDGQPARPPYPSHKIGTMRPNIEELGYRESPPPPPPPPTSTHPLYQSNMQRSPDNRYTASVGEPPKGGYYPSSPSTPSNKQQYQLQGTNPWEREEREREQERRREVAKEWRDQQISELLSLGPNRNQSQEEQLRALRLEKEFERRAQEEEDDDEEDHETVERIQDVMRAAREQDELRNTVPPKSSSYTPPRWAPNQHSQMNGVATRYSQGAPNISEEKERLRRLKDMKMKQVEQENMKYEEQRYKQQKDTEDHSPIAMNGHVGSTKSLSRPTHLRLDHLVSNNTSSSSMPQNHSMSTNNSYSNITDYSTLTGQAPQQRLDNLLEQSNSAPPPPERGSSFAVMSQAFRSPVTTPSQSRNDISQQSNATPKKVSFQDASPESSNNSNNTTSTPGEKTLEDPNRFINEAESMLASPKSPDGGQFMGATPGVIGTQEVYRDPRQRRLAEQQHQKLLSNKVVPVPEKLTFKEKMKMFAMETGEEGTPKDKVKISRAQRDIDNLNSPSAPNAAGSQAGIPPTTPTNHNHANRNTSSNESIDNKVK